MKGRTYVDKIEVILIKGKRIKFRRDKLVWRGEIEKKAGKGYVVYVY